MFPGAGLIVLLIQIFILILIVRAILSWFPGMLYTEFGRIVLLATEWYLAPIRRVIPPLGGIDISFIVGIFLLYLLSAFIGTGSVVGTFISIVASVIVLIIVLLLIRILFGFFRMDPWHPITQMIMQSTEVFARPFRGWFPRPRQGGFDWAPVAAVVVLLVAYVVVTSLPRLGIG